MKHIVFDFDGTLTKGKGNIWKNIYKTLGYSVDNGSRYKRELMAFLEGRLSYNDWCKINARDYRTKNLTKSILDDLIKDIALFDDALTTIKVLFDKGYKLHIVSGNIGYVVLKVLGENKRYFTSINTNEFVFENDKFVDIVPTKYDCEGKAMFVRELMDKGVDKTQIYFVGNGINDEWVASTGCRTICINPEDTDSKNQDIWHGTIDTLSELIDILK